MHTEGSFSEQPINVWGISDKDLYLEANKIFNKQTKPFFAYIQTAGNHHPYDKSIAPEDTDFVKMDKDKEVLKNTAFEMKLSSMHFVIPTIVSKNLWKPQKRNLILQIQYLFL
jgi:phosphoglycerol transferase MdoB-like AlkP superfamily enzyme